MNTFCIALPSFINRRLCNSLRSPKRNFHGSPYLGDKMRRLLSSLKNKYRPEECEAILKAGSVSCDLHTMLCKSKHFEPQIENCPVTRIDIATLGANQPCEDRWNIGVNQVDGAVSSILFSVNDGHSGTDCVDVLNRAGLEYVAASLLDTNKLLFVHDQIRRFDVEMYHIMRRFYPKFFPSLTQELYEEIWRRLAIYVEDNLKNVNREPIDVVQSMQQALLRLDSDISAIALDRGIRQGDKQFIHTGLSGAVGIFGRIFWAQNKSPSVSPSDIHLANTGDCLAAIFSKNNPSDDNHLNGMPLTIPHTAENAQEVLRLLSEHPQEEQMNIIRHQRLLGELAPLRAFGDVRYKWTAEELQRAVDILHSPGAQGFAPLHYYTPPYLTAKPDITRHEITANDKYLVVATDGLWDTLTVDDVAQILRIAELTEKKTDQPPTQNLATLLTKHALGVVDPISGQTDYKKFSATLALPKDIVRYVRDDITVMVVYFESKT